MGGGMWGEDRGVVGEEGDGVVGGVERRERGKGARYWDDDWLRLWEGKGGCREKNTTMKKL